MTMRLPAVVAFLVFAIPAVASAQQVAPDGASGSDSSAAPHMVDMHTILDAVGARSHKRFLVSPALRRTIDIGTLKQGDIDYPALLSLLALNGYVAVDTASGVELLPDADARQFSTRICPPKAINALDNEWVTVTLPVKGLSAPMLVPILRPLMPQNAHLASVVGVNALLIVDRAANAKRIVSIVEGLEALPLEPVHDN